MDFINIFDEEKAAEVAAFFLKKAGGELSIMKLMKLMYLSERKSYEKYGYPIIGDDMCSMPRGPVLIKSYQCSNGEYSDNENSPWERLIADRSKHNVAITDAASAMSDKDFRNLSKSDIKCLLSVWDDFKDMGPFELSDYTHEHCHEWTDPNGSCFAIPVERLLHHLGYVKEQIATIVLMLKNQAAVERSFLSAREPSKLEMHASTSG